MGGIVDSIKEIGAKGGFFSNLLMITNPYLAFAVNVIGNMLVSAVLSKAFARKPKTNYQSQLQARTEMVKQAIITRDTVYGETKKSGGILFMESTNNNQDLHVIVQMASHEIQSIDKVYFGEDELTLASAGTDGNGVTQFKVTSPSKYATESRFTNKTRSLVVSEYVSMPFNTSMPFGGSRVVDGKGIKKGITSITLVSDVAFSVATTDTLNINGITYGISSGGSSSASGARHTLAVTISEGLQTDVQATSISFAGAFGTTGRITPYRDNPNTPKPFLAGTTTTTEYAIVATQTFTDTSDLTVRIKKHLGSDTQQADQDLVNAVPQWTTSHMLSGIAYLYVKLKYDADAFPQGLPNISAEIKGKKILDFRTGSTAFSKNPALVLYDYLSDTRFGLSVPTTQLDTVSFTTVANICDEDITLSAGGTENRYEANGIIYSNVEPMTNIDEIIGSMLGILSYSNGKFTLAGGKFIAPSITLDEDDFRGGITIQTKQSRRNLFNTVKGIFTSPESNWQPSDYPMITSSTFVSEDNDETIFGNIDLPFTISSTMAQRIAKVVLFKNRQQMVIQAPCKLSAFKLQVGDTVTINNTRLGFNSKIFQVADWTFVQDETDVGIDLILQETSSSVFDWNAEEAEFISDNTNLPTAETVSAPSIELSDLLRAYSGVISTILLIKISSSQGTTNEVEIEYRNTATDTEYTSLGRAKTVGTSMRFELKDAEDGMTYEVRARSINAFNVASSYATATHEVVGKTAPPANVADFSVNIVNNLAVCSWTANEELDLSHYIIRHTPATSSPIYAGATIVANYISKATNQMSLPAQTGTYMIKAVDVLGITSETSTKKVVIRNQIADNFNVVTSTTQSTGFAGTKTDTEVVARDGVNFLQIKLGELFDDHSGNFDSALGNFDDGGEVASNLDGFYEFSTNPIDLGAIYNSQVTTSMTSTRFNANSLFDSFEGLFDSQEGNFDGSYTEQDDVDAKLQISTSNDNSTYSDFADYILGDYKARYIKLRVKMTTTNADSTPAISALSATIDMPDRTVAVANTASTTASGGKAITFSPAFKDLQGLGISASNLATGDFYELSSKSATGFTIKFKNSSGSVVDRSFDFVAKGFGYLESS
tara:strand:+ start:2833 stop:6174 length:3342 start_codon:yes stop_codon:yes gene_type:complete